jgi:hypothetical protein
MSTSTYELLTMSRDLLDMVETDNGVLTVDAEKTLIDFLVKSEDKLYACMTVIRRLDAEAEFIRAEEKRLAERRKGYEVAVERIKDLAAALLEAREKLGEEPKVKTPQYTAWLQETESIFAPEDITDWPTEWTRIKVEPDKKAALAALKSGTSKAGFVIMRKRGVRFR